MMTATTDIGKHHLRKHYALINSSIVVGGRQIQHIDLKIINDFFIKKIHLQSLVIIALDTIEGLVQDCIISTALAIELLQYCTEPIKYMFLNLAYESLCKSSVDCKCSLGKKNVISICVSFMFCDEHQLLQLGKSIDKLGDNNDISSSP